MAQDARRGSMRATPAGLLLLTLSLICAVQLTKAAYGDDTVGSLTQREALQSTLDAANEDAQDTVTVVGTASWKVNARIALETANGGSTTTVHHTSGSTTASSSSGVSKVPVITSVVMNMARQSFATQHCISIDPWVQRRSRVVVSWNMYAGNIDSNGVDDGLQCSRVFFFETSGCQGEAVDSISNPGPSAILYHSTEKTLRKWASVSSVVCDVTQQKDRACAALRCEPGGKCVVGPNGDRSCKWVLSLTLWRLPHWSHLQNRAVIR